MNYPHSLLEEELKNRVGEDFFSDFNHSTIKGRVDFCIADKQPRMGEPIEYLWAEAKRGKANLDHALVQLILTIGKAQLHTRQSPPIYLGAFDATRIYFVPFHKLHDIFWMNDFNWSVTPSDHSSKEFSLVAERVQGIIEEENLTFDFAKDVKELRKFIKKNFIAGKEKTTKIPITKTNFITIYSKWEEAVRPTIAIDWTNAKEQGIISADFYLADLLSQEGSTLTERLYVILRDKHYRLIKGTDTLGMMEFREVHFSDNQRAYNDFWNKYQRPPKKAYWDFLLGRRDLLVPQDVRERKGSYFTPRLWVELSQQYLAEHFGDNWQEEYYVWDCAAGTGNLLNGLSEKYRIFASTLDEADVKVMQDRAANGANLLPEHIFQFDFLNDEFDCGKLPKALYDIIQDEEKRKKLIIYINPPYAEAGDRKQLAKTGKNKEGTSIGNRTHTKYKAQLQRAGNELFAQFLIRIYHELSLCKIAEFSTLKTLQSSNFQEFRRNYRAKLEKIFLAPADTFDNVKGKFPIGFKIWDTAIQEDFTGIIATIYDSKGQLYHDEHYSGQKSICLFSDYISSWVAPEPLLDSRGKRLSGTVLLERRKKGCIGMMDSGRTDFSHSNLIRIEQELTTEKTHALLIYIYAHTLLKACVFLSVRLCIPATWINDRDQFATPFSSWESDAVFHSDCLAYTLFHGQNRISSQEGINHWIPFTEQEVHAPTLFKSHFMTDFIAGKLYKEEETSSNELFEHDAPQQTLIPRKPMTFSPEATAVFDAGRALWCYYFAQAGSVADPDVALYDIRLYFQGRDDKGKMNSDSPDAKYMELIGTLRQALKALARKIEPKVYEHGFLRSQLPQQ